MTVRIVVAAALAATGLLAALPASAACSLKTQPIPVSMQGLRAIVTPRINGQEARFVLDSGAQINTINGKLAAKLGLKPLRIAETGTRLGSEAQVDIQGAEGASTLKGVVVASKFELAGATFKDVSLMASDRGVDADGLIGQAFLRGTDVEYDLGAGSMKLVKAEGCGGTNLAYWAKDGTAYSVLPLEWIDRDQPHTEAAVYINGVRMRAAFDTGSPLTFITESAAARAGIRTTDPGVQSVGNYSALDAEGRAWIGTFKSIKVGDEEIQNAPLWIGQSVNTWYDVLIGADFFLSHHLYVANSQGKIYITYSGGPPFRVPQPTQPGETACAMQVPLTPPPLGPGTVTRTLTPDMIKANIESAEAQVHGLIDPAYAERSAVLIHLDSGRDQVGRLPPGTAVQIGDRVALQGLYRNTQLPCHYIPNAVTAVLGPANPAAQK
jgi:predicted aspartyl protease